MAANASLATARNGGTRSSRPEDARIATNWVEQKIDKRSMLTNKDRVEDVRDVMWQLEKDGEIVVHRVRDEHEPIDVKTLYGWDKTHPHDASSGTTSPAANAATFPAIRRRSCG